MTTVGGWLSASANLLLAAGSLRLLWSTRAWRARSTFPGILIGLASYFLIGAVGAALLLVLNPMPSWARGTILLLRGVAAWVVVLEVVRTYDRLRLLMVALGLAEARQSQE